MIMIPLQTHALSLILAVSISYTAYAMTPEMLAYHQTLNKDQCHQLRALGVFLAGITEAIFIDSQCSTDPCSTLGILGLIAIGCAGLAYWEEYKNFKEEFPMQLKNILPHAKAIKQRQNSLWHNMQEIVYSIIPSRPPNICHRIAPATKRIQELNEIKCMITTSNKTSNYEGQLYYALMNPEYCEDPTCIKRPALPPEIAAKICKYMRSDIQREQELLLNSVIKLSKYELEEYSLTHFAFK